MPYIDQSKRKLLDKHIDKIVNYDSVYDVVSSDPRFTNDVRNDVIFKLTRPISALIEVNGDLNYVISKVIWTAFEKNKRYATADYLVDILEKVKRSISADNYKMSVPFLEAVIRILCIHSTYSEGKLKSTLGTLTCVQYEFYRRQVADYEDSAIARNGDLEIKP